MNKLKKLSLPLVTVVILGGLQPAYATPQKTGETVNFSSPIAEERTSEEIAAAKEVVIEGELFTEQDRQDIRREAALSQQQGAAKAGASPEISTYGIGSLVRKGIVQVLRFQKHRLPQKVQPWADKIIYALDYVEAWEVGAIQATLMQKGIPGDVAYDFAYWAVFVFGV